MPTAGSPRAPPSSLLSNMSTKVLSPSSTPGASADDPSSRQRRLNEQQTALLRLPSARICLRVTGALRTSRAYHPYSSGVRQPPTASLCSR
jgi:hypothetical protein